MKLHTLTFEPQDKISFDAIFNGTKTIESRAATEKYKQIKVGDTITFICEGISFSKVVTKVYYWKSVEEMAQEIPLATMIPWVESLEEAKKVYASFPNYEQKIKEYGLLGFELKKD